MVGALRLQIMSSSLMNSIGSGGLKNHEPHVNLRLNRNGRSFTPLSTGKSPLPSDSGVLSSTVGFTTSSSPSPQWSITHRHIQILSFGACTAAISATWLFCSAIPALLAFKRAAESMEKLMDVTREELPGTMASIRLSGMEISDLTMELSDLGQEITQGVRNSTRVIRVVEERLTKLTNTNPSAPMQEKTTKAMKMRKEPVVARTARGIRQGIVRDLQRIELDLQHLSKCQVGLKCIINGDGDGDGDLLFLILTAKHFGVHINRLFKPKDTMKAAFSFFLLLLCLARLHCLVSGGTASIGINYGQIANNLPTPENVVPLVKAVGATRLKLYDSDPHVLKAFANTGVEFIVSIGNQCLLRMKDPKQALSWVKSNVQCYLPATKITCIAVGNEVLTFNDTSLSAELLPAMQSVYAALVTLNLQNQVTVTTAHSLAVLQTSYPPSAGRFRPDLSGCITQIVNFHTKTGSPFLINAYPYFAYKADPKRVAIEFVLFQQNAGIVDPASNLHYDNMLFAQIDAVHSALERLGFKNVCVQISETGWPSKGDTDEAGATPENARKYNGNLLKLIDENKGTPMRPDTDLNIYVFALFNENMKPGPTSERNYGLFQPNGSPVYNLGFNVSGVINTNTSNNNNNNGGSGGGSSSTGSSSPPSSSAGYLSITSDSDAVRMKYGWTGQMWLICVVATFYWTVLRF